VKKTHIHSEGVLLIYTGGTIGSVKKNQSDPDSPLIPADPKNLFQHVPEIVDGKIALSNCIIDVDLIQTEEVIDSTVITPAHWVELADLIEENYDRYEGFVILHGTDTMAYTASALAFMIDHLDKPIILTGAQRPISESRSDAAQNLITAIEFAAARSLGKTVVPEVTIYFHDRLIRGCRSTKYDADAYEGFTSPNYPPLGRAGGEIEINEDLIRKSDNKAIKIRRDFDRGVAVLELSPLMSNDLFERVMSSEELSGVILKTYGAGNSPDGRFLDIIKDAIDRGVKVVNVTQCYAGTVRLGHYDVSTGLLQRGVISGVDMTPEAAQTKLAIMLADPTSIYDVESMMQVNLKGEMDNSLYNLRFGAGSATPAGTIWSDSAIPASKHFDLNKTVHATLRISGIKALVNEKTELGLSVYLGKQRVNITTPRSGSSFAGTRKVEVLPDNENEVNLFFDMTEIVIHHLEEDKKNSISIISENGIDVSWDSIHLAIFTK
jgi:L-asparaginase